MRMKALTFRLMVGHRGRLAPQFALAGKPGSLRSTRFSSKTATALALQTLLRKEVIQPQVLLQLPCYDFTPITKFTIET
jgi:hypothetical protein